MENSLHGLSSRDLVERMFAVEFGFMKSGGSDLQLLAEAFHPEVVVHEPPSLPYAGDWTGLDGAGALMREMNAAWSAMEIEALDVHGDGSRVLLSCRLRLTVRQTGEIIEQPFAESLRFVEERLIEGTPFYFDTAALAAALGQVSPAPRS